MTWTPTSPYQTERPFNEREYDAETFDIGVLWTDPDDNAVTTWTPQTGASVSWN